MINYILTLIGLRRPATISEITAPMRGIIEQLTAYAEEQEALAETHKAEMLRLSQQADAEMSECKTAQSLCRKYSELV